MTCLVTGATGFIGRRLMRRLLAEIEPARVSCLIKTPATALEAAALDSYRKAGVRLIEADLVNQPVSSEPAPSVDVVFHLAANIDTEATQQEARVNDVGTRNFLGWLGSAAIGARIVYASSVAVHDRDRRPNTAISENSPLVPRTAYGKTKLVGEKILQECASGGGYSWTILRLPTVYGPGQKPGGLFDRMLRMASNRALLGRIDWPGRTSIIYVDDVADVMLELARREDAASQVYCVASDESLTVGEIARKAGIAVGRPVTPIRVPRMVVRATEALVWNRTLRATVPPFARVSFWRLSLMLSDGFWFDTTKFRAAYRRPLRALEEGLSDLLRES